MLSFENIKIQPISVCFEMMLIACADFKIYKTTSNPRKGVTKTEDVAY